MDRDFLKLIAENSGFEYTLGFRDDEDHIIGGTESTVWYYTEKGRLKECWTGELKDGVWTDRHILKKKDLIEEPAASGKTIAMITERAFFGQDEIEASGRKPVTIQIYEHPCSHYVYSFGARAYDVSDEFGVTVTYSDIDDEKAGWRLRNIMTGKDVKVPKIR